MGALAPLHPFPQGHTPAPPPLSQSLLHAAEQLICGGQEALGRKGRSWSAELLARGGESWLPIFPRGDPALDTHEVSTYDHSDCRSLGVV